MWEVFSSLRECGWGQWINYPRAREEGAISPVEGAGSPRVSSGQGQLSMALVLQCIFHMGPCVSTGNGHQHYHPRFRTMASSSRLGHDVTMGLNDSKSHPDVYGPSYNKTLGHQHGHRCQPKSQASAPPIMITGATDIKADSDCLL